MVNEKLTAARVETALESAGYRECFGEIEEREGEVTIRIIGYHPIFSINERVAVESVEAALDLGRESEDED